MFFRFVVVLERFNALGVLLLGHDYFLGEITARTTSQLPGRGQLALESAGSLARNSYRPRR